MSHGLAHFAFQVDDALAFQAKLEAKGVKVVIRAIPSSSFRGA
jgi:hypothetical protein